MKTTKEKIAVMQAFEDGKKIEYATLSCNDWEFNDSPKWDWFRCDYRIAAEPKLRPWKPEEVPVGALYRYKSRRDERSVIIGNTPESFQVPVIRNNESIPFDRAMLVGEHSTDGGKTWHPCGIKE